MKPETAPLRVYICGSHSTGKTTLARWIATTYGLPFVNEVARAVLAEMETTFDRMRLDLGLVAKYQVEVFKRQASAEDKAGHRFVSDRAFDNLAYAAAHTLMLDSIMSEPGFRLYVERLHAPGSILFLIRPHRQILVADGTREAPDWDEVVRIDGMVRLLFELHGLDYVSIGAANMAERARTVRAVLRGMGVAPKV